MTAEPSGPLTVEQVGHLVRNFLSSPATFPMEVVTERLNALLAPILVAREAAAQEEMRERCAKVADAFEAAYSTGARAVLKRIAEDIRALPLAGATTTPATKPGNE